MSDDVGDGDRGGVPGGEGAGADLARRHPRAGGGDPMKRPSYRDAVFLLAFNDDEAETDPEIIKSSVALGIVATMFGVEVDKLAHDVLRLREANQGRCATCGRPCPLRTFPRSLCDVCEAKRSDPGPCSSCDGTGRRPFPGTEGGILCRDCDGVGTR